jgi:thioredoxin 1
MALLCIGGICIPYTIIWPILLLFLRPLINIFWGTNNAEKANGAVKKERQVDSNTPSTGLYDLSSEGQFDSAISTANICFIKFTAKWCKPCKAIEPVWVDLSSQNPGLDFISVDVDEFDELAAKYLAVPIPLFVAFHKGEELKRLNGGKDHDALRVFVADSIAQIKQS